MENTKNIKMRKVRKINEAIANVNAVTTSDLWVVQTSVGSEPYHVFIKKEDAEVERDRYAKEYYDYYRNVNKRMSDDEFADHFKVVMDNIKVITLADAIDKSTEAAVDNATMQGEEY